VLPAESATPTIAQYAEAIGGALQRGIGALKGKPLLFLEPGRAIVDEAMSLLTTVVAAKRLSTGAKAVIIDAGVHLLPTAYYFKHEIAPTEERASSVEDVAVYGPLCMQIDVVRSSVRLPPLKRGSRLVIKNVGAYNLAQSMQFIFPRPAVVLINKGKVEVVRSAETTDDVRRLEKLPANLLPA
jgi:diaminopimelate decarboxylase